MPVSPDGRRYYIPCQLAAPCSANTCHNQIHTTFHAINKLADVPGLSYYTLSTRSWCYDTARNHLGQVHKGSRSSSFHDPLMCSRTIPKLSHSRQKANRVMKQRRTSFQTTIFGRMPPPRKQKSTRRKNVFHDIHPTTIDGKLKRAKHEALASSAVKWSRIVASFVVCLEYQLRKARSTDETDS